MKRFDRFFAVFLLGFFFSLAPSAKAQGTFTAATCNQADVNKLINGPTHVAVNGDTINIPAGSCTWTTGINVPSGIGISIIGAGQGVTVITDQLTGTGNLFVMSPRFGSALTRISGMTLLPHQPSTGYGPAIWLGGGCTSGGCPNVRVDHITAPGTWAGSGVSDDSFIVALNVFGVIDHNSVGDANAPRGGNGVNFVNVGHGQWQGIGNWGDNSWATPDTFGTNQAVYLENNTFTNAFGTDTDAFAPASGGGRYVCRFNTFNGVTGAGACANHGTDTTGRLRGARQLEDYHNTGTCTSSTMGCPGLWGARSAVGIVFGNSFSNSSGGFLTGYVNLDAQRRWRPDTPWGTCDGTSPWDQNDGVTYYSGTIGSVLQNSVGYIITDSQSPGWTLNQMSPTGAAYSFHDLTQHFGYEIGGNTSNTISTANTGSYLGVNTPHAGDSYQVLRAAACLDQPARGAGLLVTGPSNGSSPVLASTGNPGSVNQVLDPWYEFMDSGPATLQRTVGSADRNIIANRDYYTESINQASQTSPTSPFNGTSGNGHGTLANRPTTCTTGVGYWATDQGNWNQSGSGGQGELYVCTTPNTWTLHYTPYTYPHPLVTGGTSTGGNSPNPPTALAATVQ